MTTEAFIAAPCGIYWFTQPYQSAYWYGYWCSRENGGPGGKALID